MEDFSAHHTGDKVMFTEEFRSFAHRSHVPYRSGLSFASMHGHYTVEHKSLPPPLPFQIRASTAAELKMSSLLFPWSFSDQFGSRKQ